MGGYSTSVERFPSFHPRQRFSSRSLPDPPPPPSQSFPPFAIEPFPPLELPQPPSLLSAPVGFDAVVVALLLVARWKALSSPFSLPSYISSIQLPVSPSSVRDEMLNPPFFSLPPPPHSIRSWPLAASAFRGSIQRGCKAQAADGLLIFRTRNSKTFRGTKHMSHCLIPWSISRFNDGCCVGGR